MKKYFWALTILVIPLLIIFHEKIVERYIVYKLSNWVERKISFDKFSYEYPNLIRIKGINVTNSNPNYYYDNIFEADLISIDIDLKTYLFKKLVIVKSLKIDKPNFFLEIFAKKTENNNNTKDIKKNIFDDNIGIAKKINENLPDKIWPSKKRDINFLILKSSIVNGMAYIKVSSIKDSSKINLSSFEFFNIGNQKGYQHYKDVLKIILFDIFARETDQIKKEIIKEVYKL